MKKLLILITLASNLYVSSTIAKDTGWSGSISQDDFNGLVKKKIHMHYINHCSHSKLKDFLPGIQVKSVKGGFDDDLSLEIEISYDQFAEGINSTFMISARYDHTQDDVIIDFLDDPYFKCF